MFDKLLDLIVSGWNIVSPFQIIKVYQTGAVLRFGKYHRTIGPGFRWKWPFAEDIIEATTVLTTFRLPPQSLTTSDDKPVVVAAIIKYQIVDVQSYTEKIYDQHDVLADVTMGAIRKAVSGMTWADLRRESPEKEVVNLVRKEVNQFGFKVHAITFTDLARVRSFRLMQQAAKDLEN